MTVVEDPLAMFSDAPVLGLHPREPEPHSLYRCYQQSRAEGGHHHEVTNDVIAAIAREKQIKGWDRAKRKALIEAMNPTWDDLLPP